MSDDEPDAEPPIVRAISRVTLPDRALVSLSASVSLVLGFWLGWFSIPDPALAVPKTENYAGEAIAAYTPVPTWALIATIVILLLGLWWTWRAVRPRYSEGSADAE